MNGDWGEESQTADGRQPEVAWRYLTSRKGPHDFAEVRRRFREVEPPENPRPALLELAAIGKSFGVQRALDNVDFELRAGEVHVLAGENGAGKSTLVKILAGIYSDFEGLMRVDGAEVRFKHPAEAARRGIAMIHQELSLIDSLSVADNIMLGRERGRDWFVQRDQERAQVRVVCEQLELPATDADLARPVGALSLALKNRIEIAKALAGEARILVMDEPTSALSQADVEALFRIVENLKQRGAGIIYITHKMEEIFRIADRITVLRDGKRVAVAQATDTSPVQLIQWMIGRPLSGFIPPRETPLPVPSVPRLEVRDFSVADARPGRPDLVRKFAVTVAAGEIVGLAGLQGSGCSEALQGLFEGARVTGEVRLDGEAFMPTTPADSIEHGIGFLTSDRKATGLVLDLSVGANISLASLPRISRGGFLREREERESARQRVEQMKIRVRSVAQGVGTLSGGNQQKVVLAKWLETEPRVLLLDEPTRGVDVGAKHEIYRCLRQLAADGLAILLTSTELVELTGLCDRIVVLHRGAIAATLQGAGATPERIVAAAMGGEAR